MQYIQKCSAFVKALRNSILLKNTGGRNTCIFDVEDKFTLLLTLFHLGLIQGVLSCV